MSRLRFNIRDYESVPDGFRYTHPETGHTDRHVHKEVWLRNIRDHLRRMNLPIPDDIDVIAEDQCCRLLPLESDDMYTEDNYQDAEDWRQFQVI